MNVCSVCTVCVLDYENLMFRTFKSLKIMCAYVSCVCLCMYVCTYIKLHMNVCMCVHVPEVAEAKKVEGFRGCLAMKIPIQSSKFGLS